MKKTTKFLLGMLATSIFAMSSCEDKSELLSPEKPRKEGDNLVKQFPVKVNVAQDMHVALIAKAMAKSLAENSEMRKFVKAGVEKKFDGDYDLLLSDAVEDNKFKAELSQSVSGMSEFASFRSSPETYWSKMAEQYPLLNISVPVHVERWNADVYAPLVAYVPSDFNEGITKYVTAFDGEGNEVKLDAAVAPNFPVVIIGMNERVKISGNGAVVDKPFLITPPDDCFDCDPIEPIDPVINLGKTYYKDNPIAIRKNGVCRTAENRDLVTSVSISNISSLEAWVLGAPEMRLRIMSPTMAGWNQTSSDTPIGGGSFGFEPPKRADIDNKWYNIRLPFGVSWDPMIQGNALTYTWVEEDGGPNILIDISLEVIGEYKGVGGTFRIGTQIPIMNSDDMAGSRTVYFGECPAAPYDYYSVGYVTWRMMNVQ